MTFSFSYKTNIYNIAEDATPSVCSGKPESVLDESEGHRTCHLFVWKQFYETKHW